MPSPCTLHTQHLHSGGTLAASPYRWKTKRSKKKKRNKSNEMHHLKLDKYSESGWCNKHTHTHTMRFQIELRCSRLLLSVFILFYCMSIEHISTTVCARPFRSFCVLFADRGFEWVCAVCVFWRYEFYQIFLFYGEFIRNFILSCSVAILSPLFLSVFNVVVVCFVQPSLLLS